MVERSYCLAHRLRFSFAAIALNLNAPSLTIFVSDSINAKIILFGKAHVSKALIFKEFGYIFFEYKTIHNINTRKLDGFKFLVAFECYKEHCRNNTGHNEDQKGDQHR